MRMKRNSQTENIKFAGKIINYDCKVPFETTTMTKRGNSMVQKMIHHPGRYYVVLEREIGKKYQKEKYEIPIADYRKYRIGEDVEIKDSWIKIEN